MCDLCGSGSVFFSAAKEAKGPDGPIKEWVVRLCSKCSIRIAGKWIMEKNLTSLRFD